MYRSSCLHTRRIQQQNEVDDVVVHFGQPYLELVVLLLPVPDTCCTAVSPMAPTAKSQQTTPASIEDQAYLRHFAGTTEDLEKCS